MIAHALLTLTLMSAAPAAAAPAPTVTPDEMARQAYDLFRTPATWNRAADLLLDAARKADDLDPRAVQWTLHAGNALVAAGKTERARQAFELAGERGLEFGAVESAARAYLSAATLAAAAGDRRHAETLMRQAEQLSHSPHISPKVRQGILRGLGR